MPSISWSLVFGLISLLRNSFSSCQTLSIALQSGDSGGVFYLFIPFCSKKIRTLIVTLDVGHCPGTNDGTRVNFSNERNRILLENVHVHGCIHVPFKNID